MPLWCWAAALLMILLMDLRKNFLQPFCTPVSFNWDILQEITFTAASLPALTDSLFISSNYFPSSQLLDSYRLYCRWPNISQTYSNCPCSRVFWKGLQWNSSSFWKASAVRIHYFACELYYALLECNLLEADIPHTPPTISISALSLRFHFYSKGILQFDVTPTADRCLSEIERMVVSVKEQMLTSIAFTMCFF